MKKIMLIHPGAIFSTADVYSGMKAGLEANGVKVVEYRLDQHLQLHSKLVETAIVHDAIDFPVNPFIFAGSEAIGMAVAFKPDAVIAISGGNFHIARAAVLSMLGQQRQEPMPTAIYCTESPYVDQEADFARAYDVVFTNERQSVERFTQNARVHYLPHAYNPAVHHPGPAEAALASDVFFCGTGFPERRELFAGVDWTGIDFKQKGFLWTDDEAADTLMPKDVTANMDVVRFYRSAKINLNHHRTTTVYGEEKHIDPSLAHSLGPRAYEIAACGGFQLCDDSRGELFEVFGDAAATYKAGDSKDLEKQIRYWLAHPERRRETAALQHKAVLSHTWAVRSSGVLSILSSVADQQRADRLVPA